MAKLTGMDLTVRDALVQSVLFDVRVKALNIIVK